MYFPDPVYEEDLLKQNEARDTKFQNLKKNLTIDIAKNLIAISKKFPNYGYVLSQQRIDTIIYHNNEE